MTVPDDKRQLAKEMYRDGTANPVIQSFVGLSDDEMDGLAKEFDRELARIEALVGKPVEGEGPHGI